MADILFSEIPDTSFKPGTGRIETIGRTTRPRGAGTYITDGPALEWADIHPAFIARNKDWLWMRYAPDDGEVSVEVAGAIGDDGANDRDAILAAHAYAKQIGAPRIRFDSKQYGMAPIPPSTIDYGQGPQPCYVVPHDARTVDGRGATFYPTGGKCMAAGFWYTEAMADAALAADVAAGDRTVTVDAADAGLLAPGDEVVWKLGDIPFDAAETYNWGIARIEAVSGDRVTLDKAIPAPFALTDPAPVNRHLRRAPIVRDLTVRDITVEARGGELGIAIYGGERITLERLGGRNLGGAVVTLRYCEGASLIDCWQDGANWTTNHSGTAFSFSECRNVRLERPRASGLLGMLRAEAGAELSVTGAQFENSLVDENGAPRGTEIKVFTVNGRARMSAHDTTITGHGGYILASTSNGQAGHEGQVNFSGRTRLIHPSEPYSLPLAAITGTLDMTIAGVSTSYDFTKLRRYRRRFNLRDGQYRTVIGPMGVLIRAHIYVSPGVALGNTRQLAAFTIGRQGDNGTNYVLVPGSLVPGSDKVLDFFGGLAGGTQWTLRDKPLQINVTTVAGGGLDAAGEFVEIEAWIAEPVGLDRVVSEADWRGDGTEREVIEARFAGYDLPAIAAGDALAIELSIPDMAAGDFIESVQLGSGLSGLAIRSAEALAGKARVTFENPTAAEIDKAPTDIGIAFSHSTLGA